MVFFTMVKMQNREQVQNYQSTNSTNGDHQTTQIYVHIDSKAYQPLFTRNMHAPASET